jgi:hypothetical protein
MDVASMRTPARSTTHERPVHHPVMARKVILLVACLLLLIGLWWAFQPPPLDLSKEEEPFRSMVLPPKSVKDGGSVTFWVTDQNNVRSAISFPIDYDGIITRYPSAYHGEIIDHWDKPSLKDSARAKAIMIWLFREYGDRSDPYYEETLRMISEPLTAMGRGVHRKFTDWIGS